MERWWDSDDVAGNLALVDGSDPQMGVSVAVLGFHALTKAKLEGLASQTLVDRRQLEGAFDAVDLEPVSKAIAAATSDTLGPVVSARYADLVVNDLRVRGAEAAGRLAATLVAKGLPWPKAVARTASVAGVPLERLGRYATQAAAPGLDALSVADMADRVLMDYAAHRGQMEMPASVEVSKDRMRMRATQREREEVKDPEFEEAHARDRLGQFAAMNQQGAGAEREEQEKRKAERVARRARRDRRERREQEAKPPVVGRREEGVQRRAGEEEQQVDRNQDPSRQVQRHGGGVDWENMRVVAAKDVPPTGELQEPIWVNEPLYLVVTSQMTQFGRMSVISDLAYQKGAARKLAGHINRTDESGPGVSLLRFSAEGAAVLGRQLYQRQSGDDKFESVGFKLYTDGNLVDNLEIGPEIEQGFTVIGRQSAAEKEVPIYEVVLTKSSSGGQRARVRQREQVKDPDFEDQHARNRLGQFAAMADEAGVADTKEQMAERKKLRVARRARREKREATARQEAVARQEQAQTSVERQVGRREQVERRVERRSERERPVQRQNPSDLNDYWHDFVERGMQEGTHSTIRATHGGLLDAIGFSTRDINDPEAAKGKRIEPTYFRQLEEGRTVNLHEVLAAKAATTDKGGVTNQQMENIQDAYEWMGTSDYPPEVAHLFASPSDEELVYIWNSYRLASRISGRSMGEPTDSSHYADVKTVAEVALGTFLGEMHSNYQRDNQQQRSKSALENYEEIPIDDGFFYPPVGSRKKIMRDSSFSPGPDPQMFVSGSLKPVETRTEHQYISVVHPNVTRLMGLIADVTNPNASEDLGEINKVQRINAAKQLIKLYEPTTGKADLPLSQLIEAALQQEEVKVAQLREEIKLDLVTEQLRRDKHPAVRLDNVDVLRFS